MASICIRCVRTVPSTKQLMPGKIFELSAIDQSMQSNTVRIVYYYKFSGKKPIIKELVRSLSEALTCFPAITGRLQRDDSGNWRIKSNDAGVRVVEARATVSLDEWMMKFSDSDGQKLTYWDHEHENSYVWSPLHIQLTEFEGGGLTIGLSCTHLVADVESLHMLVKAWANTHASSGDKLTKPPLFYPLASNTAFKPFSNPTTNDMIECWRSIAKPTAYDVAPSFDSSKPRYETVTFLFSEDAVGKCLRGARQFDSIAGATVGVFESLAALFWISCSKAEGTTELLDMILCVDMRKAMGFGSDVFGNAMFFGKVHGREVGRELPEGGEHYSASRAIHDAVRKMEEDAMDFVAYVESDTNEFDRLEPVRLQYGPDLVCVNLANSAPYSDVFQDGIKPFNVTYRLQPVVGKGQILIIPSNEGGLSRSVVATLPIDQASKLKEDIAISRFKATILDGM